MVAGFSKKVAGESSSPWASGTPRIPLHIQGLQLLVIPRTEAEEHNWPENPISAVLSASRATQLKSVTPQRWTLGVLADLSELVHKHRVLPLCESRLRVGYNVTPACCVSESIFAAFQPLCT